MFNADSPQLYSQQRTIPEKPMRVDWLSFPAADWKEEISCVITLTVYVLWAGVCILV